MILARRSGCKVGWITTDDLAEATALALSAAASAERMLAEGYDFGYLVPGSVKTIELDGKTVYEVTTP